MSWEAWGGGPEPFDDYDSMSRHGWEFDEDMTKARKDEGEWIDIGDAINGYLEWLANED